jgi:hypothetical protein
MPAYKAQVKVTHYHECYIEASDHMEAFEKAQQLAQPSEDMVVVDLKIPKVAGVTVTVCDPAVYHKYKQEQSSHSDNFLGV